MSKGNLENGEGVFGIVVATPADTARCSSCCLAMERVRGGIATETLFGFSMVLILKVSNVTWDQ